MEAAVLVVLFFAVTGIAIFGWLLWEFVHAPLIPNETGIHDRPVVAKRELTAWRKRPD